MIRRATPVLLYWVTLLALPSAGCGGSGGGGGGTPAPTETPLHLEPIVVIRNRADTIGGGVNTHALTRIDYTFNGVSQAHFLVGLPPGDQFLYVAQLGTYTFTFTFDDGTTEVFQNGADPIVITTNDVRTVDFFHS